MKKVLGIIKIKKRNLPINHNQGDLALIKNKQIISKHVFPKKTITVRKNNGVTVVDARGFYKTKFNKTDQNNLNLS
jgi:hypothetical protein